MMTPSVTFITDLAYKHQFPCAYSITGINPMKNTALVALLSTFSAHALADGNWKLLPVQDADYKPDVTVSVWSVP
jgi:hypothetical protein